MALFQLSEGFVHFLSWGTSFTGGGGEGRGDNIHNVIIHSGTFFTPTPSFSTDDQCFSCI